LYAFLLQKRHPIIKKHIRRDKTMDKERMRVVRSKRFVGVVHPGGSSFRKSYVELVDVVF